MYIYIPHKSAAAAAAVAPYPPPIYICIYICVCVHICTFMYISLFDSTVAPGLRPICVYMHTYERMFLISMFMFTFIYTSLANLRLQCCGSSPCTSIHICMYMCIIECIYKYVYLYTYVFTCVQTLNM